jgi:hypothetical protein
VPTQKTPAAERESDPQERRRSHRRRLSFVKSAVLQVGKRSHVVAVVDLAPDGAFLKGNVDLEPNAELTLRLVFPRDSRQVSIRGRLLRRDDRFDPASGRPAGIAVRFEDVEPAVARLLQDFTTSGPSPSGESQQAERFEYQVLEQPRLEEAELNRLGFDGWRVSGVLPTGSGVQLVLYRRF